MISDKRKRERRIIKRISSICDICFKKVPAFTFERKGMVFIEKKCAEHGIFVSEHIWDDPKIYGRFSKIQPIQADPTQAAVILTNKCNLNCPICLANANKKGDPDFDFADLDRIKGYEAVLLTGGEPTVREDLPRIIGRLRKKNKKVVLLSNGLKLADENYVRLLKKSGLSYVRLQFDSLKDETNLYIRGRNLVEEKKKAILNLQKYKIPVVMCVLIVNNNFKDLRGILKFALGHSGIKSISLNPLWKLGRYNEKDFVSSSKIIKKTSDFLGITKEDWIESTVFLVNLDKLISMFVKRKRTFCMCNLKCLLFFYRRECIPVTKILNLKAINKKMDEIYRKRNYAGLLFFIFKSVFLGSIFKFVVDKKFRFFFFKLVAKSKFLLKKDFVSFNPFYSISVESFMTESNFDFGVSEGCNFHGYSSENFVARAACLNRINSSDQVLDRSLLSEKK